MLRRTITFFVALCSGCFMPAYAQLPTGTSTAAVTCSGYSGGKATCTVTSKAVIVVGRDTVIKTTIRTVHDTLWCVTGSSVTCNKAKPVPVAPPAPPPVSPPAPPPVTPPPPPIPPPPPAPVPSGSLAHPMFLPTAGLARWNAMKAQNHPWQKLIASNCAVSGTASERYGDNGSACALIYAMEGDTSAKRKAVAKILAADSMALLDRSYARQECIDNVLMADEMDAGLTPTERAAILKHLNGWITFSMRGDGTPYSGGIRQFDSDESISHYFCMALLDAYTRGTPVATHWLDSTMTAPIGERYAIGGLGSHIPGSLRDLIETRSMASCAAGGEWGESSQYNPNTQLITASGWAALRNAYGVDSLPTMGSCLQQSATMWAWNVTPDRKQMVQWGDDQDPRDFAGKAIWRVSTLNAMLAGITGSPVARGLVAELVAKYGYTGYQSAEPILFGAWMMPWYDPYGVVDSTPRQGTRIAPGRGDMWVRTGASLFWAAAMQPTREDHQQHWVHAHQLYRNGEWAISNPIGYGTWNVFGPSQNGAVYAGLGSMYQQGVERYDTTSGVSCVTGSTSGSVYQPGYYDPPPPFLTIGRRTTCYTQINGIDVVVTKDSVVISKPTRMDRYYPSESQLMDTTGGWYAVVHPQTVPTHSGNVWNWTTPGNQSVQLTAFGSNVTADSLLTESVLWAGMDFTAGNPTLGYQLRLRTSGQVLVTVTQVGGTLPIAQQTNGVTVGARNIAFP